MTNTTSGTYRVNVTAMSANDSSKLMYINTTTTVPIVIAITNPDDGSFNTTGSINVTAALDANGTAKFLNWNGVNNTMMPNTSQPGYGFLHKYDRPLERQLQLQGICKRLKRINQRLGNEKYNREQDNR